MATIIMGSSWAPQRKVAASKQLKIRMNFKAQRVNIGHNVAKMIGASITTQMFFILDGTKTFITAKTRAINGMDGLKLSVSGKNSIQAKLTEEGMRKMGYKEIKDKNYCDVVVDTLPRTVSDIADCYELKSI
jgi:hypothetical protein